MPDINPTLASSEQAIRDEQDRNTQHVIDAAASVHQSSVNLPSLASDIPHDLNFTSKAAAASNPTDTPVVVRRSEANDGNIMSDGTFVADPVVNPNPPVARDLAADSLATLKTFNDRFIRIVEIFEDYRAKAQAGKLTAGDEKLAGAAIEHARLLVETHKPLPPLPSLLRTV
jgi:hypothetical protein